MAYTAVHQWAFKEQMGVSSDEYLQIYSDNLADLIARAMPRSYGCYSGKRNTVLLVNFANWLYYKNVSGTTAVVRPYNATIGSNVTLSEAYSKGGDYVELTEAVSWLAPGMPYFVDNVLFAIEMETINV